MAKIEPGAGTVPADVTALLADVGDASTSTLNSLYGILGNPAQSFLAMVGYEGAESLAAKLTAARAALIDQITALRMAELDAANMPADIDTIKAATDKLSGGEYTGTVSAGTAAKTTIYELATTDRIKINSIWLDLSLLVTAGATIILEHKIDGINYKVFETDSWLLADDDGVLITGFTIQHDFKISITGGEGAGVNIPYSIIYTTME
jgi:hypothetical protein